MRDGRLPSGASHMSGPPAGVLAELGWVHNLLRRDLATVRKLAREVGEGASAEHARKAITGLKTKGPLWQLRVNCLGYCSFVHAHHEGEDRLLFPAVRRSDPARMNKVVDRLESDHRKVSDQLDEVEASARLLKGNDDAETRRRLVQALDELSTHLLEHLAYEEESLAPLLQTWTSVPRRR